MMGFAPEATAVEQVDRHEAECGRNGSVAATSAPVAEASRQCHLASDNRSRSGARVHSADGDGGAHPVSQLGSGDMVLEFQIAVNPGGRSARLNALFRVRPLPPSRTGADEPFPGDGSPPVRPA